MSRDRLQARGRRSESFELSQFFPISKEISFAKATTQQSTQPRLLSDEALVTFLGGHEFFEYPWNINGWTRLPRALQMGAELDAIRGARLRLPDKTHRSISASRDLSDRKSRLRNRG